MPGHQGSRWKLITALIAALGACACVPTKQYQPPADLTRIAVVFHEIPTYPDFSSTTYIRITEVNRQEPSYMSQKAWEALEKSHSIDTEGKVAIEVSNGTQKLLVKTCRQNHIPFCWYKCASTILRLEAAAKGLYMLKVRVGDDNSKFRIVDAANSETLVGPVVEESECDSLNIYGPSVDVIVPPLPE